MVPVVGCGSHAGDTKALEQLFHHLEDETTARARRKRLEDELRRMEDYAESISVAWENLDLGQ